MIRRLALSWRDLFAIKRGYAICTAPRSGSNLFGQYLASTDKLGKPLEYFNTNARRTLDDPAYPDVPRLQIGRILTMGMTRNGVYGVKVFASQDAEVVRTIDWTRELPSLSYIYLERRDRLGQALSWARAVQTSQYRSTQPRIGTAAYDGPFIRRQLDAINFEYAQWSAYFCRKQIRPLKVIYEDLILEPQKYIDQVAGLVGVHPPPRVAPERIDLAIQRDATTEAWRERFLREDKLAGSVNS